MTQVHAEGKITAAELIAAFERCLAEGWGYVYGGQGERYTEALARAYTEAGRSVPAGRDKATYFTDACARWYGHRVADCSGGIVAAFRAHVPTYRDQTANGFFRRCRETGPIETLPERPGLCLWKSGHIGVYIGGGEAIEFRGTSYGCVKTKVEKRPWTHWGVLADVVYDAAEQPERPAPIVLALQEHYLRGDGIAELQRALNALGYPAGEVDGICGEKTMAGVRAFAAAHGALPARIAAAIVIDGREYRGALEA